MQIEIKDVVHLYLACECKYEWRDEAGTELHGFITTRIIEFLKEGRVLWVKPILRPLSHMSQQEKIELKWSHNPSITKWLENGNFSLTQFEFLYMLKQGFDLFGLIQSNLAIDKTTCSANYKKSRIC